MLRPFCAALVMALLASAPSRALAQQPVLRDSSSTEATRQQLEAYAQREERAAQAATDPKVRNAKLAAAAILRDRLRDGDFRVGDRIALVIPGDSLPVDTVEVRADQSIQLPNMDPISLRGVLHSELQPYLTKQLAQYLRNPQVQAVPLVRVALLGEVGKPGFYALPADTPIEDAVMIAGGPTHDADVNRTVLRRGDQQVLAGKPVQQAFTSGLTLDQLDVQGGDAIVVGQKSTHNWLQIAQITAASLGILVSLYYITHRH